MSRPAPRTPPQSRGAVWPSSAAARPALRLPPPRDHRAVLARWALERPRWQGVFGLALVGLGFAATLAALHVLFPAHTLTATRTGAPAGLRLAVLRAVAGAVPVGAVTGATFALVARWLLAAARWRRWAAGAGVGVVAVTATLGAHAAARLAREWPQALGVLVVGAGLGVLLATPSAAAVRQARDGASVT